MYPPSVGPRVGPTITPTPKIAIAVPNSSRGNTSYRIACEVESRAPPPNPWMIRQNTSAMRECALPQKNDATTKIAIHLAKQHRPPKYPDSQPVLGRMATLPTLPPR